MRNQCVINVVELIWNVQNFVRSVTLPFHQTRRKSISTGITFIRTVSYAPSVTKPLLPWSTSKKLTEARYAINVFEKLQRYNWIAVTLQNKQKQSPRGVLWKRCSQKFCTIHRKTRVPGCNFIKKRLAQVFSCEFCEISNNTFYHRTPLVAVSE